jgi:hypothetical protein
MTLTCFTLNILIALNGSAVASSDAAPAQSPQSSSDDTTLSQKELPGFLAKYRYDSELEKAMVQSGSPREWSLVASEVSSLSLQGALLRKAAEAAPNDWLAQWLWANAPAEMSGCDDRNPCPNRIFALERLDPGNAASWIPAANVAANAHDWTAADAVLARMARADRFDDYWVVSALAWAEILRAHHATTDVINTVPSPNISDSTEGSALRLANHEKFDVGFAGLCSDHSSPRPSTERLENCAKIGRLMLRHGNSIPALYVGRRILEVSGEASSEDFAYMRVITWQLDQHSSHQLAFFTPAKLHAYFTDFERTKSEVEAMRLQLQRDEIPLNPPTDWQSKGLDGKPTTPKGDPLVSTSDTDAPRMRIR